MRRIFFQSLDEADIALLKSYGQGQYTKAIKVSSQCGNHEQIVNFSLKYCTLQLISGSEWSVSGMWIGAGSDCCRIRIMICVLVLYSYLKKGTIRQNIFHVFFLLIFFIYLWLGIGYRYGLFNGKIKLLKKSKIKEYFTFICTDIHVPLRTINC